MKCKDFPANYPGPVKYPSGPAERKYKQSLQHEQLQHEQRKQGRKQVSKRRLVLCLFAAYAALVLCASILALAWLMLSGVEEAAWVKAYGLAQDDYAAIFAVALHWVLSQSTFASMEPVPRSQAEKHVDLVAALLACIFLYPLLGLVVLLVTKVLPLCPAADASRKQLALRCLVLVLLILVQVLVVAGTYTVKVGDDKEIDSGHVVQALHWSLSQFTFTSVELGQASHGDRLLTIIVQLVGVLSVYPLMAACGFSMYQMLRL